MSDVMGLIEESPHFTVEEHGDREAWLRGRFDGFGGSEAAAVWGFSRYDSPYSLVAKKRGLLPDDDVTSEAMEIGTLVEPAVAELYARRAGRTLTYPGPFTILRSKEWPWLFVSLDRLIAPTTERAGRGVLECKNRGAGAATAWKEAIPDDVQAQVQHALIVTGFSWGAGAAIIGGNQFRYAELDRMDTFAKEHIEKTKALYAMVQRGELPSVDGHEATTRALEAMRGDGERTRMVTLPAEAEAWTAEMEDCTAQIKELEERKKLARNRLIAAIGTGNLGVLPSGAAAWEVQTVERASYTVKASQYDQLVKRRKF